MSVDLDLTVWFGDPSIAGDPRAVFDDDSQRFIIIATNFADRCYIAVSSTSDPTGAWFRTSFIVTSGLDAPAFPDYPTLGVDQNGIYTCFGMFGSTNGDRMTIFALDKAPLIAASQSLGTITAFRDLPFEGAIQPAVTHGAAAGEHLVSLASSTGLRVRRVNPPLTAPSVTELGIITIPTVGFPPNTPAMGSTVPLNSVGDRFMNAVYRNGSVWTAHCVEASGRAGARWYEVDVTGAPSLVQVGTVTDPVLYFSFPTLDVNVNDDVLMGFSGSSPVNFGGGYVAGRRSTDPLGEMSPPILLKDGENSYEVVDFVGRNRWGDYSLTTVDPVDDTTFWTVQEFASATANVWSTWIGAYDFGGCTPSTSNYCATAPNSATSGATIGSSGSLSVAANAFSLTVDDAPPGVPGLFFYGASQIQAAFGDGFRCVGAGGVGTFRLFPATSVNAMGSAIRAVDFTSPPAGGGSPGSILGGSTWNFQFWFRDPMGPGGNGFNLSDGLSATFCP